MATIQFVLVDDWELRGDGSGDMRALQFATLRQLLEIYERYKLRGSINAEVMQQIYHRRFGAKYPELARLADEWEEVVLSSYRRGHDVQLHIHSQWRGATYEDGRWKLTAPWSILQHPPEAAREMLAEGKAYLEGLLRTVNPDYSCVSYRSGAWCLAPSDHMLSQLAELGIVFDMSICAGLVYNNSIMQLDYSQCEEDFLPYYPAMHDARKVSESPTPIVCLPTFSFFPTRWQILSRKLTTIWSTVKRRLRRTLRPMQAAAPGSRGKDHYDVWSTKKSAMQKLKTWVVPPRRVADLAQLDYPLMLQMIRTARRHAGESGLPQVPVILENHTKDLTDFRALEHFAAYVSRQPDIEVITLAEVARNLKAGLYQPITKRAQAS